MKQLPKGYYAVQSDFENAPKDSFTFRGETYSAEEGINLFATAVEAMAKITEDNYTPDTVLTSLPYENFSAPVMLFSVGEHSVDKLMVTSSVVLLGERCGVSPNLTASKRFERPDVNPVRLEKENESILKGGFWHGNIRINSADVDFLTVDGFTMRRARLVDARATSNCDTEIVFRNIYHESPCLRDTYNVVSAVAGCPYKRTLTLEHVRLEENFDELGYGRLFISFVSNKLVLKDVCIDKTSQLFGFSNICRSMSSCARNADLTEAVFENCYINGVGGENGITFVTDKDHAFVLHATDCAFIDASRPDDAPLQPVLANKRSALILDNCYIADTRDNKGPAVAVRGKGKNVQLNGCMIEGFATEQQRVAPPPTKAPDKIKNRKIGWTTATSDPHKVIGENKADYTAIDEYYKGCKAYYGDLHTHSSCGGTSDGSFPLKDWTKAMDELDMDFTIMVDHKQMRGYFLPEWDETRFLYGTEPGAKFTDLAHLPNNTFHYNMIFPHKYGLAMVLANFPEFNFKGDELTGKFGYPGFTKERFSELNDYIRSIGGMLVHAHPKMLLASNDPLDYYIGEHSYLETIVSTYTHHGAFRACDLWDQVLKCGKHMYASGGSDTHGNVTHRCPSTFYTTERHQTKFVERMYVGDYAVGGVGVKMMIDGNPMGSELIYKKGMKLSIRIDDFFKHTWKENTAYELQVLTDKGVAYSSVFNGKEMQELSLEVQKRLYYRIEIKDITHGYRVCVSNPIWLDGTEPTENE